MAKRRAPRILFFTQDAKPTEAELNYADDLGANVGFRHGRIAASATKPEVCDGVAAIKGSLIPLIYAQKEVPRVKNITDVNRLKPAFGRGDLGYTDDDEPTDTEVLEPGNTDGEPNPGNPNPPNPDDTEDEDDENETAEEKAARLAALAAGDGSANRPRSRRRAASATGGSAAAALLSQPPAAATPDAASAAPAAPAATPPEPAAAPAWAPPANPGT